MNYITLAFWVVLGVLVAAGLGELHHSIYTNGAKAQQQSDQKALDAVVKERDESKLEYAALNQSCGLQSLAIDKQSKIGQQAQDQTRALLDKLEPSQRVAMGHIGILQQQAASAPKGTKDEQCDKANDIINSALRGVRK